MGEHRRAAEGRGPCAGGAPGGGLTGRMLLASGLLLLILAAAFTVLLVAVADLRGSARGPRLRGGARDGERA